MNWHLRGAEKALLLHCSLLDSIQRFLLPESPSVPGEADGRVLAWQPLRGEPLLTPARGSGGRVQRKRALHTGCPASDKKWLDHATFLRLRNGASPNV